MLPPKEVRHAETPRERPGSKFETRSTRSIWVSRFSLTRYAWIFTLFSCVTDVLASGDAKRDVLRARERSAGVRQTPAHRPEGRLTPKTCDDSAGTFYFGRGQPAAHDPRDPGHGQLAVEGGAFTYRGMGATT